MSKTIVFTDGASRGNPGPSGWGVVAASDTEVIELGGHMAERTNNQAELTAVKQALQYLQDNDIKNVTVYTDSSYLIQGITNWRYNWQQNGWQTKDDEPVKNKQLWQDLINAQEDLNITYEHVDGHAGIPANERADDIASSFADGSESDLYSGSRKDYGVSLDPQQQLLDTAPVYLSLVGGVVEKHDDWSECKQRVEGVDAQYRKVRTIPERDDLLDEWGKSLSDL